MFDRRQVRQRAYMMGIATGDMPNVDLIWAVQELEGHQACFGNGRHCVARHCRWRKSCLAMDFHTDHSLPLVSDSQAAPIVKTRQLPPRVKPAGRPRTVAPSAEALQNSTGLDQHRRYRQGLTRLAPPNALPPLQTALIDRS